MSEYGRRASVEREDLVRTLAADLERGAGHVPRQLLAHARPGLRVHLHSTYSDGTGTVRQIARAGRRAGADVVLLTDHDTLAAKRNGEEGWYDERAAAGGRGGLAAAAQPLPRLRHRRGDRPLGARRRRASARRSARRAASASPRTRSRRARSASSAPGPACPSTRSTPRRSTASSCGASSPTPARRSRASAEMARFLAAPGRVLDHPPARNLRAWDELCRRRRVVAIGGIDAHQFGKRIGPVVPLRLMAYHRSFRYIRTHVLCRSRRPASSSTTAGRSTTALREGRCYIAVDSLAPAARLRASRPTTCRWAPRRRRGAARCACARRPTRSCGCCATASRSRARLGRALEAEVEEPGVYRVEALRRAERPRAHLDPVQPDLPARLARAASGRAATRRGAPRWRLWQPRRWRRPPAGSPRSRAPGGPRRAR